MEGPGVFLKFRVVPLVDYLTSFSGVDLSFLILDLLCFLRQADKFMFK